MATSPSGNPPPVSANPSEEAAQLATHLTACAPITVASDLLTANAPSFAPTVPKARSTRYQLGDRIDDFEIVRQLGEGGFAQVYLARQLSLGRLVALKVGPNRGQEARTLASLEHDNIVQVFTETVLATRDVRLLCMQYVPGATLQDVLDALPAKDRQVGTGKDYLAALDRVCTHHDEFRPAALLDRETIAQGDFSEAVCWIGVKLAEALAFAHQQGILHRDIKPANILINAYGRPFLADFNLAHRLQPEEGRESLFGGTLAYMSPEHLEAFAAKDAEALDTVDERADLYGLGLVLYELHTGRHPYPLPWEQGLPREVWVSRLAQERSAGPPPLSPLDPNKPSGVEAVLCRCLEPDPKDRLQSAGELATALAQCRQFRSACNRLPPLPTWAQPLQRHPFAALLALAFIPNLIGSLVNIAYNTIHIVGHLTASQREVFNKTVLLYNGLAYPVLVGVTCWLLIRLRRGWRRILEGEDLSETERAQLRRQARYMIVWSMVGTSLGWLPGGFIFPTVIHTFAEPLSWDTFGHFIISFTVSGLIAVTYCYLGSSWIVLRVLDPVFWAHQVGESGGLREEVRRHPPRLGLFQCLAGIIPLAGAILMVLSGAEAYGVLWFRLLVCALIVLGIIGFIIAVRICQYLNRVLVVYGRDD